MLKTATANRKIALEIKREREEICVKATEGRLPQQEEIEFIMKTINSKIQNVELVFNLPFRISDKSEEILVSMLYQVFRTNSFTVISC